jgi:hypothetical protein
MTLTLLVMIAALIGMAYGSRRLRKMRRRRLARLSSGVDLR